MLRYIFIIAAYVSFSGYLSAQQNPFEKITYENEEYFVYPKKQEVYNIYTSEEFVPDHGDINNNDIYRLHNKYEDINIDGKWIVLFDSSVIKPAAIFTIKNNLLNGDYISYYYIGAIHIQAQYNSGLKTGAWDYFDASGKPEKKEYYNIYKDDWGKLYSGKFGEWKKWWNNGNPAEAGYFDSSGYRDSVWIHYFSDGTKQSEEHYSKGRLNGISNFYYTSGALKSYFVYGNSKTSEAGKIYYQTGEKKSEGNLFLRSKTGFWMEFYTNGKPKAKGNYKLFTAQVCRGSVPDIYYHSTKTGRWIYYFEDGSVMAYGDYYPQKDLNSGIYVSVKAPGWAYFDKDGYPADENYFKATGINMMNEDDSFLEIETK